MSSGVARAVSHECCQLQRVAKRLPGLVNGSNKGLRGWWAWRVAPPPQRGAKLNQSAIMLRGNGSNDPIQASVSPSWQENQIPLSDQTMASPHSAVVCHMQRKDKSKEGSTTCPGSQNQSLHQKFKNVKSLYLDCWLQKKIFLFIHYCTGNRPAVCKKKSGVC